MYDPFTKTWEDPEPEALDLPVPQLTYPTSLPHDLACAMSDEEVEIIRTKYEYTPEEFDYILNRQDFKREFSEWRQRLISEGNSFKMKCRAMAEDFLPTAHSLLKSELVAPSVKTDLFKYLTRVAELEPVKETQQGASAAQQTRLVIQWQDGSGSVAVETKNG